MSQAAHMDTNVLPEDTGRDGRHVGVGVNLPQSSVHNWTSQGQSDFADSSWPLFAMYSKMAETEDNKMAERWHKDAQGILVFTGLFSATVATLVTVSMQDLRPNSQDTSAFYLENIYQLFADPNVTGAPIIATRGLAKPPAFSPPKYAILVNSLWFLSLAISLSCALLATLLQQWVRRYIRITQPPRYSPHKRARTRAFFAEGVDDLHVIWVVEALPTLLHLSLSLFFAGLLIYLFNIDHTVFSFMACWVAFLSVVYGCITFMPVFRHDSPYFSPLSWFAWCLYTGVAYAVLRILWLAYKCCRRHTRLRDILWTRLSLRVDTFRRWLSQGIRRTAEEAAWKLSAEVDGRILMWTFNALDEDHELEKFFEGILGFFSSKKVRLAPSNLAKQGARELSSALTKFLYRTRLSDVLSESVKKRRLVVCAKVVDEVHLSDASLCILDDVFLGRWRGVLQSVEMGHSLISRNHSNDKRDGLCAQSIVAGVIASVREHDDRWVALAMNQLDVSESVLREYAAHGDSVLLANFIHIARQILRSTTQGDRYPLSATQILPSISKFNVRNTLPQLQYDFCSFWNEAVLEARKGGAFTIPVFILRNTRRVYTALHQDTHVAPTVFTASTTDDDPIMYDPSSYPLCNIVDHRPTIEPASHIPHAVIGSTRGDICVPALSLSIVPDHDTIPATVSPHCELSLPVPRPPADSLSPLDDFGTRQHLTGLVVGSSQSVPPKHYGLLSFSPNMDNADAPQDIPNTTPSSATVSSTPQHIPGRSVASYHDDGNNHRPSYCT